VLQATALEVAGLGHQAEAAPQELVAAQRWLAAAGPRAVVVPFARELAALVPVHEVRMRRDFTQLLTLIRAHALLHQQHRERDDRGRVVATLVDYGVVYDIVQPVFAASLSAGLTPEVRATVEVVAGLATAGNTVTVTEIARRLSLSPSATWRRIRGALDGRWLVNEETRKYQPAKIRVGEPMPEVPGLPALPELAQTCKRTAQPLGESADGRLHGRLQAGGEGAQVLSDGLDQLPETGKAAEGGGVNGPPDFWDAPLPEPPADAADAPNGEQDADDEARSAMREGA
jgi:hypothetical protein